MEQNLDNKSRLICSWFDWTSANKASVCSFVGALSIIIWREAKLFNIYLSNNWITP